MKALRFCFNRIFGTLNFVFVTCNFDDDYQHYRNCHRYNVRNGRGYDIRDDPCGTEYNVR